MTAPESKTCVRCGEPKPLSEYLRRRRVGRVCHACRDATTPCPFPGCDRAGKAYGTLCSGHYMQQRMGYDLAPLKYRNTGQTCGFPDCDRPAQKLLLCTGHYHQQHKGQELAPLTRQPSGIRLLRSTNGYVEARVYSDHPLYQFANPREAPSRRDLLHRLIMSQALGRRLLSTETVHHKDGDRANNALSNLQLRHGNHGQGQRIVCADCGSHNTTVADI